jgi:hypothetical protein
MFANNEVGSIQPIKEISKICQEKNIFFLAWPLKNYIFVSTTSNRYNSKFPITH